MYLGRYVCNNGVGARTPTAHGQPRRLAGKCPGKIVLGGMRQPSLTVSGTNADAPDSEERVSSVTPQQPSTGRHPVCMNNSRVVYHEPS